MDLKNLFKNFIKIDSILQEFIVKRDFFLEKNKYTYTFDGEHFFKIEKKFVNFFILKFFSIQQCINPTNKASWKKTKDKYKHGHLNNKRQYWTKNLI